MYKVCTTQKTNLKIKKENHTIDVNREQNQISTTNKKMSITCSIC